jgi:hypothetical protein
MFKSGVRGVGGSGGVKAVRRPRRSTARILPPVEDMPQYMRELVRRHREAVEYFTSIEARIKELYDFHVEQMGDEYEGWIHLKNNDPEATRLFSLRENSRQRARTYADAVMMEIELRREFAREFMRAARVPSSRD